jgi:hypothetical protein
MDECTCRKGAPDFNCPRHKLQDLSPTDTVEAWEMERYLAQHANRTTQSAASGHACNCLGCCRRCGSCRTWPGHTKAYCDLLVQQADERKRFQTFGPNIPLSGD